MLELELIERAQQGDKAAYTELIHIHHRTVEKFAFQCGVLVHDIPDVTQEVFVKLYRFLHQFQRDRFTTWLYKITLNTARDYYRKETKEKEKSHKLNTGIKETYMSKSAEDRVLVFEEDRELHKAIQSLDEKYRHPIIMFYFHELSYEQIAEVLNVPLSTIKIRQLRAKALLKSALQLNGGVRHGR
ncbi:sigma-70 family RNA polymerase sigma factor [Psychrobacillus psychrodurans]|jgi:RNA polymerase sigma-70 factor (ECF subfamily)|uniref:RNA polymerase sigma factor n=1 Tax=Psychrobacillus TaxID=1221880 RepID=UPI001F4EEC2C|nr:sigma-70 family RNA polymerase sigma factor [Psychrobacillus psychrodurans]MCK1998624.1 sigma-70 family RNA polymerase sigma factor [Psychrobacillus psychrodurans]